MCADCQSGGPQNSKNPVTFAVGSTKNAIKHLKKVHRITAEGPIAEGPSQQQQTIEATFGKLTPSITFNDDVFRLLQWRYIYEAVNALECLKSWHRDELISASHAEITELEDMLNALCIQQLDGGEA
jgi:hypothetical protein